MSHLALNAELKDPSTFNEKTYTKDAVSEKRLELRKLNFDLSNVLP